MDSLINTELQDFRDERSKKKRERELSDIRFLLKSPEGRRFYWRVLCEGKMFQVKFNGDVNWLLFDTGQKNVSAKFMDDLLAAKPDAYIQMQQEYAAELESEKNMDNMSAKT